jgi:hypothetical protein
MGSSSERGLLLRADEWVKVLEKPDYWDQAGKRMALRLVAKGYWRNALPHVRGNGPLCLCTLALVPGQTPRHSAGTLLLNQACMAQLSTTWQGRGMARPTRPLACGKATTAS